MCGLIAQLVEHRTGITEVTGSNPVEALIFFRLLTFQLLKLENLLHDHSSLSLLILLSVFRVAFDAQFHRLCYKTIGSCF